MTEPNNVYQPLDYSDTRATAPTSVKVVSILGILYSALFVLCVPVNIVLMVTPLIPNPVLDALRGDTAYVAVYLVTNVINFCLGVLLLAAAIGSLRLKAWGRTGMNVFAVAHIVMTVVGIVVQLVYVMPKTKDALAGTPGAEYGMISGIMGAACGLLFGGGVATVILIVFNRKVAVNAFKGLFAVEPGNFPGELNA